MNNPNDMFNNMFKPGAVPDVKDGSTNNLNPVSPNEMVVQNNVGSDAQTSNGTLNFSIPTVNNNTSFNDVSNNSAIGNNGGFAFVDPNVTGVVNNAVGNMNNNINNVSNIPFNNNVSQSTNINNNMSSQSGTLGFDSNSLASLNSQNTSLINNGISLENINNNLMNNVEQSNNMLGGDISSNLVSSELPNTGIDISDNTGKANNGNIEITSVKSYLLNMLLFMIPLVGFIILIIKVLDKKESNIRNFARAYLLFCLLLSIIFVFIYILLFDSIMGMFS